MSINILSSIFATISTMIPAAFQNAKKAASTVPGPAAPVVYGTVLAAGLAMLGDLEKFNEEISKEGIPAFGMGLGINTDVVVSELHLNALLNLILVALLIYLIA